VETSTPAANGSVADAVNPIDRITREMEELLAPLSARREQLQAELDDLDAEALRLNAAIQALNGRLPTPEKPAVKKKPSAGTHTVSQKVLDDVYAVLAKARGAELTMAEVAEEAGLSHSTTSEAIRVLRRDERIRLTGTRRREDDDRTGGKPPSTYAVMPSA